jgi:hypothetical protein
MQQFVPSPFADSRVTITLTTLLPESKMWKEQRKQAGQQVVIYMQCGRSTAGRKSLVIEAENWGWVTTYVFDD